MVIITVGSYSFAAHSVVRRAATEQLYYHLGGRAKANFSIE